MLQIYVETKLLQLTKGNSWDFYFEAYEYLKENKINNKSNFIQ